MANIMEAVGHMETEMAGFMMEEAEEGDKITTGLVIKATVVVAITNIKRVLMGQT